MFTFIISRYALDQGASAFAIDIEEVGSGSSSIKVLPRSIQRRNQARFPREVPTGKYS